MRSDYTGRPKVWGDKDHGPGRTVRVKSMVYLPGEVTNWVSPEFFMVRLARIA